MIRSCSQRSGVGWDHFRDVNATIGARWLKSAVLLEVAAGNLNPSVEQLKERMGLPPPHPRALRRMKSLVRRSSSGAEINALTTPVFVVLSGEMRCDAGCVHSAGSVFSSRESMSTAAVDSVMLVLTKGDLFSKCQTQLQNLWPFLTMHPNSRPVQAAPDIQPPVVAFDILFREEGTDVLDRTLLSQMVHTQPLHITLLLLG